MKTSRKTKRSELAQLKEELLKATMQRDVARRQRDSFRDILVSTQADLLHALRVKLDRAIHERETVRAVLLEERRYVRKLHVEIEAFKQRSDGNSPGGGSPC